MEKVNIEKVLDVLFKLLEDQEKVEVNFTVTPKECERENQQAS